MSKKIPSALLLNDIHVSKDNIPEFQKNWDEALYICDQYGIVGLRNDCRAPVYLIGILFF